MPRVRSFTAVLAAAAVALTLAGCAPTVSVPAAKDANDPACAAVTVRLPDSIAGAERTWTDSQATGAWGDPTNIILSCGVPAPGPTTLRCENVSGVDWVIDETDAPRFRVTTFNREPAVELFFDTEVSDDVIGVSSREVLDAISPILREQLRPNGRECVARVDATPVPEPVEP